MRSGHSHETTIDIFESGYRSRVKTDSFSMRFDQPVEQLRLAIVYDAKSLQDDVFRGRHLRELDGEFCVGLGPPR